MQETSAVRTSKTPLRLVSQRGEPCTGQPCVQYRNIGFRSLPFCVIYCFQSDVDIVKVDGSSPLNPTDPGSRMMSGFPGFLLPWREAGFLTRGGSFGQKCNERPAGIAENPLLMPDEDRRRLSRDPGRMGNGRAPSVRRHSRTGRRTGNARFGCLPDRSAPHGRRGTRVRAAFRPFPPGKAGRPSPIVMILRFYHEFAMTNNDQSSNDRAGQHYEFISQPPKPIP